MWAGLHVEQRCRTGSGCVFGLLRWQNGLDDSVSARQMWTPPLFLADGPFGTVGCKAEHSVYVPKILLFSFSISCFGPIHVVLCFYFNLPGILLAL